MPGLKDGLAFQGARGNPRSVSLLGPDQIRGTWGNTEYVWSLATGKRSSAEHVRPVQRPIPLVFDWDELDLIEQAWRAEWDSHRRENHQRLIAYGHHQRNTEHSTGMVSLLRNDHLALWDRDSRRHLFEGDARAFLAKHPDALRALATRHPSPRWRAADTAIAITDKQGLTIRTANGHIHEWHSFAPCELHFLTDRWAAVGIGSELRFVHWTTRTGDGP